MFAPNEVKDPYCSFAIVHHQFDLLYISWMLNVWPPHFGWHEKYIYKREQQLTITAYSDSDALFESSVLASIAIDAHNDAAKVSMASSLLTPLSLPSGDSIDNALTTVKHTVLRSLK
jgi:hypothetical protein